MRAVVQRVSRASVAVEGEIAGAIAVGLCVLLGVAEDDAVEALQSEVRALRNEVEARSTPS